MAGKNVLIVFAHPERRSYNGTILDATVDKLKTLGHNVTVSDLYSMNFNPVYGRNDFKGELNNPERLEIFREIFAAYPQGGMADDIQSEQKKLDTADLVIFQFPMCWMGFPAILKGWFDRVAHIGYATDLERKYETANFKGRRALLSFTTGSSEAAFTSRGRNGDINVVLWPLQNGVLRYLGFDVLPPNIVYGAHSTSKHTEHVNAWTQRLDNIFTESPMTFLTSKDFDGDVLKPELASGAPSGEGWTVGQHCGKALPVTSSRNPGNNKESQDTAL